MWHLLNFTYRWDIRVTEQLGSDWTAGKPRILVFWHGQQIFMPMIYRWSKAHCKGKDIYALISEHSDGRIAAKLCSNLGIKSVAGSSSKGGAKALIAIVKAIKAGYHSAITPDGPKGPIYEVKPGVIKLAQKSQAPLVPCALGADRYWQFKSWDKMILPKPFARVTLVAGDLIEVPSQLDEDQAKTWCEKVCQALHAVSAQAVSSR